MSDETTATEHHVELDPHHDDPVVRASNRIIRYGVRVMSVIMVLVVLAAIVDAGYSLAAKFFGPPYGLLNVSDLLSIFAAALVVLIAIEIFSNITLYLTTDVFHVKMVVSTALMAVARKIITLDDKSLDWPYFLAYAGLVLALGITYWLVARHE